MLTVSFPFNDSAMFVLWLFAIGSDKFVGVIMVLVFFSSSTYSSIFRAWLATASPVKMWMSLRVE